MTKDNLSEEILLEIVQIEQGLSEPLSEDDERKILKESYEWRETLQRDRSVVVYTTDPNSKTPDKPVAFNLWIEVADSPVGRALHVNRGGEVPNAAGGSFHRLHAQILVYACPAREEELIYCAPRGSAGEVHVKFLEKNGWELKGESDPDDVYWLRKVCPLRPDSWEE